ncbi:alkaline phosphatase family protein [Lewinella sp. LCG006]|uniref:alkaline phosphatase family protein n=1 Tax=Lewinella sp. LCG006 TaxID=3231911 RepID=UPI0034617480
MKQQASPEFQGLDSFKHVVVLMLENRSFDNLLGFLYEDPKFEIPPGKTFAGLNESDQENPVPPYAEGYTENPVLKIKEASDFSQPFPDPGEVYQHVNTQLYNTILPKSNQGIDQTEMTPPYNLPDPLPPLEDRMKGFVTDYINTLQGLWLEKIGSKKRLSKKNRACLNEKYGAYENPKPCHYEVIMQCFKPRQIPVLTTLAREFAVFDHWFCSVPSQTWCNRAFWHAGTSGGKVINPTDEAKHQGWKGFKAWRKAVWPAPTLFDRLEAANITHHIYADPLVSVTHLVHGFSHHTNLVPNWNDLEEFRKDINGESSRPFAQYSFIEPKFFGKHNDQHPSSVKSGWDVNDGKTVEGTVRLGEDLIRNVYNIIKDSPLRDDTLLIITHDEHGGCFDHIYPGPTEAPHFPGKGEKDFDFKRLGIRVPMVMVASSIPKNTIVNEVFDHTSFIKTMCKKWQLEGLQARDMSPNTHTFEHIFSKEKRSCWPDLPPPPTEAIPCTEEDYHNHPLNELQRSMLMVAVKIARENSKASKQKIRTVRLDNINTVKQAIDYLTEIKPHVH